MRITTSARRLEDMLGAMYAAEIERLTSAIVEGVPLELYKERCAELRVYRKLLAELPSVVEKAKE